MISCFVILFSLNKFGKSLMLTFCIFSPSENWYAKTVPTAQKSLNFEKTTKSNKFQQKNSKNQQNPTKNNKVKKKNEKKEIRKKSENDWRKIKELKNERFQEIRNWMKNSDSWKKLKNRKLKTKIKKVAETKKL